MHGTKDGTTFSARRSWAALPALLGLMVTACTPGTKDDPQPPGETGVAPTTAHEPPAEAQVGDPMTLNELPPLPDEGVAVELEQGLVFVGLDGNVHGHVPGATLQTARGLQHAPAGLVPVSDVGPGDGWLEPSSGVLWPVTLGTPLIGEASAQLDPHAGSPDAYVIHRPDAAVARWERDDRWWLSRGHRTVTWERCPQDAGDLTACPMHGHDLDMGADLELEAGCWVSDTSGDLTQLRVCTDFETEPKSWIELAPPGQEPNRYQIPRSGDLPDDMAGAGRFLAAELEEGWILAKASMQCEVGMTALIDVATSQLQPILGEDEPLTVASVALGWTGDGRAAVLVDERPCAENEVPGVWLIDPTGEAELVYPLPRGIAAEGHLWRPVPGVDLGERAPAGVMVEE